MSQNVDVSRTDEYCRHELADEDDGTRMILDICMYHHAVPFVSLTVFAVGDFVSNVRTAEGVMIVAAVEKSYSARTRSWNCRYASTMLFCVRSYVQLYCRTPLLLVDKMLTCTGGIKTLTVSSSWRYVISLASHSVTSAITPPLKSSCTAKTFPGLAKS